MEPNLRITMSCSTPTWSIPTSMERHGKTMLSRGMSTRHVNASYARPKSPPTHRRTATEREKQTPDTFFTRASHRNQTRPYENQTTLNENQTTLNENQTTMNENQTTMNENQTTMNENQTTLNENQTTMNENQTTMNENQTTMNENHSSER